MRGLGSSEDGASTVEHVGIGVVVVAIIAGVITVSFTPIGQAVRDGIERSICEIAALVTGGEGDCGGSEEEAASEGEEEDFAPEECEVANSSDHAGSSVDIAWLQVGDGIVIDVQEFSDGENEEYHVTMMDQDLIGANADTGAELNLGENLQLGEAKIEAGAELDMQHGDTFVFDNEEEATEYASEVEDYMDHWSNNVLCTAAPICAGGRALFLDEPEPPHPPQITRTEVSLEGNLGGNASTTGEFQGDAKDEEGDPLNAIGVDADWLPSVGVNGAIEGNAIVTTDRGDDPSDESDETNTLTFGYDAGVEGEANAGDLEAEGQASQEGAVSVELDAEDEIVALEFSEGVTTGASTEGGYDTEIESTTVPIESPDDREIAEQWLKDLGQDATEPGAAAAQQFPDAAGVPEAPENLDTSRDELEGLMYEQGVSTREEYVGSADDDGRGLGAKLKGLGLAYESVDASTEEELTGVEHLGSPDTDGVRRYAESPCF